jgi:hypothetical protein
MFVQKYQGKASYYYGKALLVHNSFKSKACKGNIIYARAI